MRANTSELPIAVSTPAWLRRHMLRNLRAAAHDRISHDRAAKAREILAAIERNGEAQPAKPIKGTSLGVCTTVTEAAQESAKNRPTGDRKQIGAKRRTWAARLGGAAKVLANRASRWRSARRARVAS